MIFIETKLKGAFIIESEQFPDQRGFFARSFCQQEFAKQGLNSHFVQSNFSYNKIRGTLRGMHYQDPPHQEAKLVRCTMGAIYDVVIDLRVGSPTFTQWVGVELTAQNRKMLYSSEGFAHGYLTLQDDTEVCYQVSAFYAPEFARTVRWDDPIFSITWPLEPRVMSEKDMNCPYLKLEYLMGHKSTSIHFNP